jgi:hypothetical protein
MANAPAVSGPMRAIDILRKAANFEPIKQEITLSDGTEFVFYVSPLNAAEREKAQKDGGADSNGFAMQLLIQKALDENGERMFKSGDIPVLKRDVEDEDLQKMILCVLRPRGGKDEDTDLKSA